MQPWTIWLVVAGVLFILEMVTLTFYLLWCGIGAVVAAIVAWLYPDAFVAQMAVGGVVVLLLTVYTKPITRRFRQSKGFKDAVDELVGKEGVVLEPISDDKPGIVKVGSETWSAVSDQSLEKGEIVVVVRRGSAFLEVISKQK